MMPEQILKHVVQDTESPSATEYEDNQFLQQDTISGTNIFSTCDMKDHLMNPKCCVNGKTRRRQE